MPEPSQPIDVRDLAAEEPFVRALARRLVEEESDEAVQQTFVQALARESSPVRRTRPWLARIVKNVASNLRRGNARRRRHEQQAAGSILVPSSCELAEREERRTALVTAVDELAEPFRSIVWLRFFEDLPPRRIAKELDLPVATVWEYQRRALELLRKKLDRDYGNRAAWLVPLVPFAVSRHGAPGSPLPDSLTYIAPSLITMAAKPKIAAALCILGLGALGYWGLQAATEPPTQIDAPDRAIDELTGGVTRSGEVAKASEVELVKREVAPPESNTWVAAGRVYAEDVGLRNVAIQAQLFRGYFAKGEPIEAAELRTAADGHFTWPLDTPKETVTLRLQVKDAGLIAPRVVDRFVISGDPAPQDLEIQVHRLTARLSGQVTDDRDRPIAGAKVRVSMRTITTDEDGRFDGPIPAWSFYQFSVVAPGHAVEYTSVQVDGPGSHSKIVVKMKPAHRVEGRVLDADGRPIAGADVWGQLTSRSRGAVSGADGTYVVDWLAQSASRHWIYAQANGYAATVRKIDFNAPESSWDITLVRGVKISGRVLGPDHRPVPGATLSLRYHTSNLQTIAVDDGSFAIEDVRPGTYTLTTRRPGYAADVRTVTVPGSDLQIVLREGRVIEGVVVDESGEPIVGADIQVVTGMSPSGKRQASDDSGQFLLRNCPRSKVQVSVFREGYLAIHRFVAPGENKQRFAMKRAGFTAGRVVDAATGEPITAYRVHELEPDIQKGEKEGRSLGFGDAGKDVKNDKGEWRSVYPSAPGAILGVMVIAKGYAPGFDRRVIARIEPSADDSVVRLQKGAEIRGQVLAPDGRAIVGATVMAGTKDRPALSPDFSSTSVVGSNATDSEGRFVLRDAPAGEVTLHVRHPKWPPTSHGPFTVASGQSTTREVRMVSSAVVIGRLVDADGHSPAGVKVELTAIQVEGTEQGRSWSTVTAADGAFRFGTRLGSGRYQLEVATNDERLGGVFMSRYLRVSAGKEYEAELKPAGVASLKIEVPHRSKSTSVHVGPVDADGKRTGDFPGRFFTLAPGGSVIRGLAAGRYLVLYWTDDKRHSKTVEVGAKGEAQIRLEELK